MRLRGGGLLSASITRWQHKDITIVEPVHLVSTTNTSSVSWIGKTSVKEMLELVMRTCVKSTRPGDFARIEHELNGKKVFCYVVTRVSGIAGALITDEHYPQRVAINLVDSMLDDFTAKVDGRWSQARADNCMTFPELAETLSEYQDAAAADTIERLKKDIEESREILQKSVDQILERGQKLEDLVMKSSQLSMQTKMMYKSVNAKPGWFEECCGMT